MKGIFVDVLIGFLTNLFTSWLWDRIKRNKKPDQIDESLQKPRRWLLVAVWGMLPIGSTIGAVYLLENRWPLTMKWSFVLLAFVFLVNFLFLALGVIISLRQGALWALVLMLFITAIQAGAFYLLDKWLPNYIAIDCPGQVDNVTTIEGRVIDPRWRVYMLIKPRNMDGSFPTTQAYPGKDGAWYIRCDFSGEPGEKYELRALAIPPDALESERPTPEWLLTHSQYKTSVCVVTKR